MSFIKKHKRKIISAVIIISVLAIAFFCGDNTASTTKDNSVNDKTALVSQLQNEAAKTSESQNDMITEKTEIQELKQAPASNEEIGQVYPVQEGKTQSGVCENTPKVNTEYSNTVPAEKSVTLEHEEADETDNQLTCSLSIRCDNAVGKSIKKAVVIPDDGVIFSKKSVEFYNGESVFNVLVREMKKNKIHLEFVNIPLYNSAYIEGINNLYEFDCGELSGWMYKVNNRFPNYGCSQYVLKNGDKIEWVYTCDLGKDVGGEYAGRNGMKNE